MWLRALWWAVEYKGEYNNNNNLIIWNSGDYHFKTNETYDIFFNVANTKKLNYNFQIHSVVGEI